MRRAYGSLTSVTFGIVEPLDGEIFGVIDHMDK
jgi:hypothetical protein